MRQVWFCASAARAGSHLRAPWRSKNAFPSHAEPARQGEFPASRRCNRVLLFMENIWGVLALGQERVRSGGLPCLAAGTGTEKRGDSLHLCQPAARTNARIAPFIPRPRGHRTAPGLWALRLPLFCWEG